MAIPDEDVAQVRASTDIVALIGEHTALRRQGRRWVGLCPFHSEKTASFSVNAEEGFYYCFGCQASGDAITFVRAVEHLDFVEAVRLLADRAHVTLHDDEAGTADRKRRTELYEALERAVEWYHERLLSAPDAGAARNYLRSRGIDGTVARQFRLGWAPDDWDALSRSLGLPERVLTDSGLGFVNRRGRRQDAFRARIIFPIADPSGRPIALGGRIIPRRDPGPGTATDEREHRPPEPKYKNSVETAIYAKRRTLYGLNWAKNDVIASGEVVVCEGYTDVIGCFMAGVPRAVATCGTALAEEHFTLLRNFARRIVLAYDADNAGQTAATRVYEWERRHEVAVAVAALPPGSDPGDLARTDPDALRGALLGARPFLQFRFERVMAAADLSSVEGRARAAADALDVIAEHPDDLVRDPYVMQVADRCRLDAALVRDRLLETRRRVEAGNRQAGRPKSTGPRPTPRPPDRSRTPRRGSSFDSDPADVPSDPDRIGHRYPTAVSPAAPGSPGSAGRSRTPGSPGSPGSPGTRGGLGGRGDPARRFRAEPASRPGMEALRLAIHRPDQVMHRLDEIYFLDELQRRAFATLAAAGDIHTAVEQAAPDVADLLRRVAVEEPVTVGNPLADPVDSVVHQLIRSAVRQGLVELQSAVRQGLVEQQSAAGSSPDDSAWLGEAAATTAAVHRWMEELDDPARCSEAADLLLAWLLGAGEEVR